MRICHVINNLVSGGAESMLHRVVTGLDKERFASTVIALSSIGPVGESLIEAGVPVKAMEMRRRQFQIRPLIDVRAAVRQAKPDVVMGWMVPSDLLSLPLGRMAGAKHVVWNIRNSGVKKEEIGFRNRVLKILSARVSAMPSAVVINSSAGLETHKAIGFHPKRWEVIYNGFDLDLFQPSPQLRMETRGKLGIPDSAPVIGVVAHFRPAKNYAMFFRAAHAFSETHPESHFVLAGLDVDDKNEKIKEMAGLLWGTPNLHLVGLHRDIRPILSAMDVMSLCSLWEGFPNAVGEAMASGVPCVVTQTAGDAPRIVGEFGRVVPSNDVDACVAAWSELIDRPDELSRLKVAGRASIAERFSIRAIIKQYEALFDSLG